jgi:hypothetical protein
MDDIWGIDVGHINSSQENWSYTLIFRCRENAMNQYRLMLIERYKAVVEDNDTENLSNETLLEKIYDVDTNDEWIITVGKVTFCD